MNGLTIICNNVPRDLIDAWELTEAERAEFDYLAWDKIEAGEDSASFFRYKGEVYDLGDCETTSSTANIFPQWDGYYSQTFFSGVLVRYADEHFETVVVGRYYS